MPGQERWLLPEGIEEVLPEEAQRLETMRRQILDLLRSWGYELVMPPLLEYLEALLTGVGHELDLQTFKVTDQLSGRLMGIRPDMTPQAARIDAHYLKRQGPVRLCYLGPVLHTRPDDFAGSREPLQCGAELFGHSGPESDAEILCLMVATLELVGLRDLHIDLGHVGVFRGLVAGAGLSEEQSSELLDALQAKARADLPSLLDASTINASTRRMLLALIDLNGGAEALQEARKQLAGAPTQVTDALENLEAVAAAVGQRLPGLPLHFDLAELTGYRYYTGAVFSALVPTYGRAVARGGRYDGIGRAFGRARPATGYSADLRRLLKLLPVPAAAISGILAPAGEEAGLRAEIERLRAAGERVVIQLPGVGVSARELGCDRELTRRQGKWVLTKREG